MKHFIRSTVTGTVIMAVAALLFYIWCVKDRSFSTYGIPPSVIKNTAEKLVKPEVKVPRIVLDRDKDGDGVPDMEDIVEGARKDAERKPRYKSAYYSGGYPPDSEGVCTDVIWRALKNAGYNLKELVDRDIRENTRDYPRVEGRPDPNIDFRRVPNLRVFLKKYATSLDIALKPYDVENLKLWQGGDIVVFKNPEHIGIISDKRDSDGVPYMIHNAGPHTREANDLLVWKDSITGHFRFPKK